MTLKIIPGELLFTPPLFLICFLEFEVRLLHLSCILSCAITLKQA